MKTAATRLRGVEHDIIQQPRASDIAPYYEPQGNEVAIFEAAYRKRLPVMVDHLTGNFADIDRAVHAARQCDLRLQRADIESGRIFVFGVGVRIRRRERTLRALARECENLLRRWKEHAVSAHLGRRTAQRRAGGKIELVEIARVFEHTVIELEIELALVQEPRDMQPKVAAVYAGREPAFERQSN